MPWAEVGRHLFDLGEVVLVVKGVQAETNENSLTITLACGEKVELVGEDAKIFSGVFREYTGARGFGKPPPPSLVGVPTSSSFGPPEGVGVEEARGLRAYDTRNHQEA